MKKNAFHHRFRTLCSVLVVLGSSYLLIFLSGCGPEPPPIIIDGGNGGGGEDSTLVSVTELPPIKIPADNPLTFAGVDLGRHLFYEKMLSGDGTMSCATCHNNVMSFTDNNNAVSEGIRGEKGNRNAMTVFNLMYSNSLFWDGRAATLRELATMPIENPIEMDARVEDVLVKLNASELYKMKFKDAFGVELIEEVHLSKALEQFLITLVSDNSKFDKFNRGETQLSEQEIRGFNALKIKGCFNCHSTSLMHDNLSHNTALDKNPEDKGLGGFTNDPQDNFKFKTPSLRNIMLSAPYMHDGRFNTIEEVIEFYEKIQENGLLNASANSNAPKDLMSIAPRNRLRSDEIEDVKAFLNALTDYTYINNPKFQDPF
ncbi:MAG: cytochrome c peroxidase [Bacteroidia bacterium]|jgi:cytochrome c peroxidase